MPTKHYKYGGSTAARLIGCPAWPLLAKKMPHKSGDGNPYADMGTLKHESMEKMFLGEVSDFDACVGMRLNEQELSQDAIDFELVPLYNAYDTFSDEQNITDEFVEVETAVSPEIGGTLDLFAVSDDAVFMVDWKFGHNIVFASRNAQLLFYAMCAMYSKATSSYFKDRKRLVLVIGQPARVDAGYDSMLDVWETDLTTLKEFANEYMEAVRLAGTGTCEPNTGEYCRYCPAQPICPAKLGLARRAMMLDPSSKEADVLATGLSVVEELEAWCKSVRTLAHEQAELGMELPGYKLVQKRTIRRWEDTEEVMDAIRHSKKVRIADVTTTKLVTPPQFEKHCKRVGVDFGEWCHYITKQSSGTTLVAEDDKRPAIPSMEAIAAAIREMPE